MLTAEDQWMDLYTFHERGWATNDLSTGLRSHPLDEAMAMTYIATNTRSFTNMLVLDVDDDDAERRIKTLAYDDQAIPEPNWVTINPHSGHGHVGYWLATPICTTEAAHVKPQQYGAAIYEGLRRTIPGDPGYTGRITRNPFTHPTIHMANDPYSLADLAAQTTLPKHLPKQARQQGLGRNCTLFDDLRQVAYSEWRKHTNFTDFQMAVQMLADTLAIQFLADPLPSSEVRAIARSVARWVWGHFSKDQFSKIQSARGAKGAEVTNMKLAERSRRAASIRNEIVRLRNEGVSYKEIQERMDLTYNQVRAHLQYQHRLDSKKRSA